MKSYILYLLFSFFFVANSEYAFADVLAKLAASYNSSTTTSGHSTTNSNRMIYDVAIYTKIQGYGNLIAGALYQGDTKGGDTTTKRTSYGVSGGWYSPADAGFFAIATYYIASSYDNFTNGNGYQVDLGYKFTPHQIPFFLQMSYKKFNYSKYDYDDSYIDPYFGFIINF